MGRSTVGVATRRDPHLIYACFCLNASLTGSGVANPIRYRPVPPCYTCSLWQKQDFNTNYSEIMWKVCVGKTRRNSWLISNKSWLLWYCIQLQLQYTIRYVCMFPFCLRVSGRCLCIQIHFSMRPSLIANLNCNCMLFVPRDFCISQNCLRLFESSKYVDGNSLGYIVYTVCVWIENNCLNAVEGRLQIDSLHIYYRKLKIMAK